MAVELKVDHAARTATRANHSATHILHEALREVLGDHVAQKGSLVSPERLRFDFAHPKPITRAELEKIEDIANRVVLENAEVATRLMGLDDARALGARALFGEKYPDEVRVVSMGEIDDGHDHERTFSIELCGGTHVRRTGDIGLIAIVSDTANAAGVRRIEAKTRDEARKWLEADARGLADLTALLRAPAGAAAERLEALIDDKRKLERELAEARRKLAMGGGEVTKPAPRATSRGVKLSPASVSGVDMKDLKSLADEAKQARLRSRRDRRLERGWQSEHRRRGDPGLAGRFNAVELVRLGAAALGGKGGGGRPDMAQAGRPGLREDAGGSGCGSGRLLAMRSWRAPSWLRPPERHARSSVGRREPFDLWIASLRSQ